MQRKISKPSLLLFIVLVGFPQISETIYTPSLPDIAHHLGAGNNAIQLTLSIYFWALPLACIAGEAVRFHRTAPRDAVGHPGLWVGQPGLLSVRFGRMVIGQPVHTGFGASTGSVVTQTILRETVDGAKRHAVFAQISAALAFTPAIGPLIGGWVDQSLGFRAVFFTLVILSAAVLTYTWISCPRPECRPPRGLTRSRWSSVCSSIAEYGDSVFLLERPTAFCSVIMRRRRLFY